MTTEQKSQIFALRAQGCGYSTIAKAMELNKDTVKSFCRRNGAAGIRAAKQAERQNRCPQCGKKLIQVEKQKPRRFCSDQCRQAWWNAHPEMVKQKAFTALFVPSAGNHSLPTATATANTAPTSAMCRPGSKGVR